MNTISLPPPAPPEPPEPQAARDVVARPVPTAPKRKPRRESPVLLAVGPDEPAVWNRVIWGLPLWVCGEDVARGATGRKRPKVLALSARNLFPSITLAMNAR